MPKENVNLPLGRGGFKFGGCRTMARSLVPTGGLAAVRCAGLVAVSYNSLGVYGCNGGSGESRGRLKPSEFGSQGRLATYGLAAVHSVVCLSSPGGVSCAAGGR